MSAGPARPLTELEQIGPVLGVGEHDEWSPDDPLWEVKSAFALLYKVAKISGQVNLPIVFHG
ncbi:MAG: hypothetical protein AMXMBFR13_10130 [Phycisphaerae bacterium]